MEEDIDFSFSFLFIRTNKNNILNKCFRKRLEGRKKKVISLKR